MATGVKWNLDEATEISVLSGWDIIKFKKHPKGWMYGVEGKPDIRYVTKGKLPALLEKYESAGCGVLIAAPRKEVLKLTSEKMVEVSTKEFVWKDVHTVIMKVHGSDYMNLKFEVHHINGKSRPVFNRYAKDYAHHDWIRRPFEWYVSEVEVWINMCDECVILNREGERMNYE